MNRKKIKPPPSESVIILTGDEAKDRKSSSQYGIRRRDSFLVHEGHRQGIAMILRRIGYMKSGHTVAPDCLMSEGRMNIGDSSRNMEKNESWAYGKLEHAFHTWKAKVAALTAKKEVREVASDTIQLNETELDMIRRAVGYDTDHQGEVNRYIASAFDDMDRLEAAGYMINTYEVMFGSRVYCASETGCRLIGLNEAEIKEVMKIADGYFQ